MANHACPEVNTSAEFQQGYWGGPQPIVSKQFQEKLMMFVHLRDRPDRRRTSRCSQDRLDHLWRRYCGSQYLFAGSE
jgi:hypothetical protein